VAGHDFAHIKEMTPEEVRPMGRSKVLLLTIVALAVVAGGFVVGFMMGQEMGKQKATSAEKTRLVEQLKAQQEELSKLRAAAKQRLPEVSTTEVGELTFYNELPQQSVDPEPLTATTIGKRESTGKSEGAEAATSSEKMLKSLIEHELSQAQKVDKATKQITTAKASETSYNLQLASFQTQRDAELFLPKLSKVGFSGVIKRVELPKLGTWYRVYAGPFATKMAVEDAKKSVKQKLNITGLVVKGD
jgi:cell division septation protein DedD